MSVHAGDFVRLPDGECRLHPQLARAVVATCRVPRERIDEHAKWLPSLLSERRLGVGSKAHDGA